MNSGEAVTAPSPTEDQCPRSSHRISKGAKGKDPINCSIHAKDSSRAISGLDLSMEGIDAPPSLSKMGSKASLPPIMLSSSFDGRQSWDKPMTPGATAEEEDRLLHNRAYVNLNYVIAIERH